MNKLNIKLENCYGIKKFENEFDFSDFRTFAIYAPNGVMKTSFAKTFKDLSNGQDSRDIIFPARTTLREIKKEDGSDLDSANVFVIEPYDQDFSSGKLSTLLVNKVLKTRYDEILGKIEENKERLLKALKNSSKYKSDIEKEISLTFTGEDDAFYKSLGRVESEVLDSEEPEFANIVYTEIFNDKVIAFLKQPDLKEKIEQYIRIYEDLISKSKYFKKGIFNHHNAATIAKSLTDNGFFEADHSVFLHSMSDNSDSKIETKEELEKVIEAEKLSILNNPALKKAFDEVDKKLNSNIELRQFRDYLAQNTEIVPELGGTLIDGFRQKLWLSYFKTHKDLYKTLLDEYRVGEKEMEAIGKEANAEAANWVKVLSIFKKRFSVPFELKIENRSGVILKEQTPNIVFEYNDSKERASVSRTDLLSALSTGERRALYILNIIFEVEARKNSNQETLFIVDDIADSFDYKNKYAIIEYLRDISAEPIFHQIILTHNFDFFRTLESRFVPAENCFTVEKSSSDVKVVQASYVRSPFKEWMRNLANDDKQLVASIPFVRNIIEYTKGNTDPDYIKLTSLLHVKTDTPTIDKAELARIYNGTFPKLKLAPADPAKKIYDLIMELTKGCLTATESINLENKIVLAMAIRLKAEGFMFSKITNKKEPSWNQTRELFDRYKVEFAGNSDEEEKISVLEQVNLMTPENIHLNSFMYEPILDMSDEHLKNLCKAVDALK